jgi:hypothetical protein
MGIDNDRGLNACARQFPKCAAQSIAQCLCRCSIMENTAAHGIVDPAGIGSSACNDNQVRFLWSGQSCEGLFAPLIPFVKNRAARRKIHRYIHCRTARFCDHSKLPARRFSRCMERIKLLHSVAVTKEDDIWLMCCGPKNATA